MLTGSCVKKSSKVPLSRGDPDHLKSVIAIKEDVLRQIGQDLHDSVGQLLIGVALIVKGLEKRIIVGFPEEHDTIIQLRRIIDEAINQISDLEKTLNPINIEDGGLITALHKLAVNTEEIFAIHCTFKCNLTSHTYSKLLSKQLYRIIQEAVTNAIKHGNAKNISISLMYSSHSSILTIKNDGTRFSDNCSQSRRGAGLRIMKYRAMIIGGSICIRGGTKGGTVIICEFPNTVSMSKGVGNDFGKD